jgi:putative chitinase
MRAAEFLPEQQLDELNWRAPAAAAGIAGAIGGGLATHNSQPTEPVAQVAPAEKSAPEIKAPVAQAAPTKNINDDLIAHAESLLKKPNAKILYQTAVAAGMQDTELAQFLAQCAHETKNFTTRREDGSKEYFMKKYDKKYNPQNAAILGNVNPGDGARYFGRGDIQLTGRDNYARVGRALGLDLINRPELAENPEIAAKIAVHFWQNRVVPRVDNFADTAAVTRPINRRLAGLDDRDEKFKGLHHVLVANK